MVVALISLAVVMALTMVGMGVPGMVCGQVHGLGETSGGIGRLSQESQTETESKDQYVQVLSAHKQLIHRLISGNVRSERQGCQLPAGR